VPSGQWHFPVRGDIGRSEEAFAGRCLLCHEHGRILVAVEEAEILPLLVPEYGLLVLDIVLHARIPIEMIGIYIGKHRGSRRQFGVVKALKLPARELEYYRVVRADLFQKGQRSAPHDVAGQEDSAAMRGENSVNQGSGRGLSAGSRDAYDHPLEVLAEEAFIHLDGDAIFCRYREESRGTGHVRVAENHVRVDEISLVVPAELERDRQPLELLHGRGQLFSAFEVRHGDVCAASHQEKGIPQPATQQAQAHHRNVLARKERMWIRHQPTFDRMKRLCQASAPVQLRTAATAVSFESSYIRESAKRKEVKREAA